MKKKSGNSIFSTIRISKLKLDLGTFSFISAISVLVFTIGYLLFGIFSFIVFPSVSDYNSEIVQMFVKGNIRIFVLKNILGMIFFSLSQSIYLTIFIGFMRNKYLLATLPFFIKYSADKFATKISISEYSKDFPNEKILKISEILSADNLLSYYVCNISTLIFYLILYLISFVIYVSISKKRLCVYD